MTGALSDRAIAAALQLANEPGLPSLPPATESQTSSRLLQLLQATGAQQPFMPADFRCMLKSSRLCWHL